MPGRKSPCMGPLREHLRFQQPSVSPKRMESPAVFIVRCCRGSSSRHCCSVLGSFVCVGTPHSSKGTSTAEVSLLMLNRHMCVWGQIVSHLHLSSQSLHDFFISLVTRLLFRQSSDVSLGCLLFNLVVILIWLWEEASTAFTYSTILTGTLQAPCPYVTLFNHKSELSL